MDKTLIENSDVKDLICIDEAIPGSSLTDDVQILCTLSDTNSHMVQRKNELKNNLTFFKNTDNENSSFFELNNRFNDLTNLNLQAKTIKESVEVNKKGLFLAILGIFIT